VAAIRDFNRRYFSRMAPVRRALIRKGFNARELRILSALARAYEGISSSAWLVGWLSINGARVSRILKDLRRRGWIECWRGLEDARINEVRLTDMGRRLVAMLDRVADDTVADLIWELDAPRRRDLIAAMNSIAEILRLQHG
jgi:DNA-binding MarR family transcriptional regulator